MTVLSFLCEPTWQRVGLALVHFLWQGLLIAVAAHGLICLSCRRPVTRYAGYLLALLVMAACPVATFLALDAPTTQRLVSLVRERPGSVGEQALATAKPSDAAADYGGEDASAASEGDANASGGLAAWRQFAGQSVQAVLPWAVVAWLVGVVVLSARTLAGLIAVRRWRGELVKLPADVAAQVPGLCRRLGLRQIPRVSLSLRVPAAMTIGWLRQIVLIPAALAAQMPTEMLQAIISHELAHIRRRDPWVNLLQRVVEVLLFYHPAVWWLSNRVRSQRELCCDELAVRATEEPLAYARALEKAGWASLAWKEATAVAFGQDRNSLLARVRHVLGLPGQPQQSRPWLAGLVVLASVACLFWAASTSCGSPSVMPGIAGTGEAAGNPAAAEALPKGARILHFPADQSLGTVLVQDESLVRKIRDFTYFLDGTERWDNLGQAKGEVAVPAGKRVKLQVSGTAWQDLSALEKLAPDDLYSVMLSGGSPGTSPSADRCAPHLARLTGLKVLDLTYASITSAGLSYVKEMKSLERLHAPRDLNRAGLEQLAQMRSLKGLFLYSRQLTADDASPLARMTSLEELELGGSMEGKALAHLAKLPSLRYLLVNCAMTDADLACLKDLPALRSLSLARTPITDAGLVHLEALTDLEALSLYSTKITDEGLVHLQKMKSLKKLDLGKMGNNRQMQITGPGLAHLAPLTSLEWLSLPSIDASGLARVGQLGKLKYLSVSCAMPDGSEADVGLQHLRGLHDLEELHVFGAGISDADMDHLANLPRLRSLRLSARSVTANGLARVATLKTLKELNLSASRCQVSDLDALNGLTELTVLRVGMIQQDGATLNLSGMSRLERLNLTFDRDSSPRDEDLACLAGLKRLRDLTVSVAGSRDQAFTDKGIAHLAGLTEMESLCLRMSDEAVLHLSGMKRLERLQIPAGKITEKGLEHLDRLPSLRQVMLPSGSAVSQEAIARLKSKLPELNLSVLPTGIVAVAAGG